jgi:type IV pilus assembly protein PilN
MIRVNLLRNAILDPTEKRSRFRKITLSLGDGAARISQTALAGRITLFLLPAICVLLFRYYNSYVAKGELEEVTAQNTEVQQRLTTLEAAVQELTRFKEEKAKLDAKLEVIKQLSRERLKNVKSLDALQSIIPNQAWLTNLKFNQTKVEIDGLATDDIVIAEFMRTLESSIYFADVVLVSSTDSKKESGVVKKFAIACKLENL